MKAGVETRVETPPRDPLGACAVAVESREGHRAFARSWILFGTLHPDSVPKLHVVLAHTAVCAEGL